jgi:hypothetical protein
MPASPETVQRVIATYHEAARASASTCGRKGSVVVLGPRNAGDVMVTGDLHGNRLNFGKLLEVADLEGNPRRHLVMQEVCHGGPVYPQGGCMSHLMLEDVARLKTRFPDRFHFLLSNHELSEWTDYPIVKASRMLNLTFRCGMKAQYGAAADQVREAMLGFLSSCPLAVRLSNGVFISHSLPEGADALAFDASVFDRAIRPGDLHGEGAVFRLVWGRDYREANAAAFAKTVGARVLVNGHEPCPDGFQAPNDYQLILDCAGPACAYVVIPVGEVVTHQQLVQRVERLE